MGFYIFGGRSRGKNYENGKVVTEGKIYKTVRLAAIIGTFVAIAVFVFGIMGFFTMNSTVTGVLITVGIICFGCLIALPWLRVLERKDLKAFKIVSLVFLAFTVVCVLLWIVCGWQLIALYNKAKTDDFAPDSLATTLKVIQAALIISIQFFVASAVATSIIKFRKTMLPFQIIAFISYAFLDFIVSFALCCIIIKSDGFDISDKISLLNNKLVLTLGIIAIIYSAIAQSVMTNIERRRLRNTAEDMYREAEFGSAGNASDGKPDKKEPAESAEDKLAKIKELRDKGLITQDEYDKKRGEIINDI